MPTEELFGGSSAEELDLLNALPEGFNLSDDKIKALLIVFMGSQFNELSEEEVQDIISNLGKKIVELSLVIAAITSGLPLPPGFPEGMSENFTPQN